MYFSVFFFRLFSLPVAVCVAIIGGYLLLPSGLDEAELPQIALQALYHGLGPGFLAVILYALAARHPFRHGSIVLVGLLGKILVPIGFVWAAGRGSFPPSRASSKRSGPVRSPRSVSE